jgi:hypothetical protein
MDQTSMYIEGTMKPILSDLQCRVPFHKSRYRVLYRSGPKAKFHGRLTYYGSKARAKHRAEFLNSVPYYEVVLEHIPANVRPK